MDGVRGFKGRHENGLNTFRIDGHGIFLGKELALERAVWGSRLSTENGKTTSGDRGPPKARPGRESLYAPAAAKGPSKNKFQVLLDPGQFSSSECRGLMV